MIDIRPTLSFARLPQSGTEIAGDDVVIRVAASPSFTTAA
jgi:hypothetical protein